jgi:predicted kinase
MTDLTKTLYIIRGLPGAGKSTLGSKIAGDLAFAADDFFDEFYNGKFIAEKIKQAHEYCRLKVRQAMCDGAPSIAVCNTFTQEWELKPYLSLAEEYGYMVHSIIVENRQNTKSVHNVPSETIKRMQDRFQVKLC